MRKQYAKPRTRASEHKKTPQPRVRPWLLAVLRAISGVYLRTGLGCRRVTVLDSPALVEPFRAALAGEIRLILAFRHPFVDEPQILGWLFLHGVKSEARLLGVDLPRSPHAIFVHGYELFRWGGPLVRWMLPRVGALPVYHTRIDTEGIARIRNTIMYGEYPLAVAPEGQVGYSSDTVPRLESGAIRLGLDAAEALAAAGRSLPVVLLPLSIHRRYTGRSPEKRLLRLVRRIGSFVGIPTPGRRNREPVCPRWLGAVVDRVLSLTEAEYGLDSGDAPHAGRAGRAGRTVRTDG
jgi:hypothetical protein